MTDKEKALAYDKLRVKAKQIYNKENDVLIMHTIEDLFPDLKESEDERIRKHLISLVKNWDKDGIASKYTSNPNDIKQILAWLEKQGTPAKLSEEELDDKLKLLRSQPKQGWSEEDEKRLRDTINTIIVYKEDTNVRCCQSELNDCIANINWLKSLKERATWKPAPETKSPEEISSEEFRDESGTSTDNPKPRFKPGEWIAHNEANFVFRVVSVGSNAYEVVNPDGFTKSISFRHEGDYHHWTAYDAKEGNVVVEERIPDHPSPFIAIFKEMGPYTGTFSSLCFIDFNGNFNEGDVGHDPSNLHPATKEQRELILKAMIDAGYTFDSEKKELKKTGQKPDEHKFHEGEWIVSDFNHIAYVESVSETKYILQCKNGYHERVSINYVDGCWHSWTIQDVKDGEVLVEDTCTFIIKKLNKDLSAEVYCCLHDDGDLEINSKLAFDVASTYPATKEQHDHLFSEMKEKGYEWLEETKELKKTGQEPGKPKFHEGEWIISDAVNKDYRICKITDIKDGNYEIESTCGYKGYNRIDVFDNTYRPWTIDEARDGEVLAAPECYVIFKEIAGLNIKCYCTYHYMGFNPSFSTDTLQNKTAFHPATKEESDTLGKAITNAGLKWDSERKKLMAIKPKFDIGDTIQYNGLGHNEYVIKEVHYPTHYINELGRRMDMPYTDANFTLVPHEDNRPEWWSEEDEEIINKISVAVATHYSCDTAVKVENWLKSLRSHLKQGWSKEDEVKLKSVCALIRNTSLNGNEGIEEFTIDWVRSLKDRVQSQSGQEWKQENTGDLTDFENAMMHIGESFFGQHAGLDPNDTSTIKEQANLLLGLVPKQGWSEDDEQYLLVCKNALSKYQVTDKWDSSIISQWLDNRLKSLKDRAFPQQQEWSEEEKGNVDIIVSRLEVDIEYWKSRSKRRIDEDKRVIDWLKSLRPQNTWKPSKEQIIALRWVLNNVPYNKHKEEINGLLDQIKEL